MSLASIDTKALVELLWVAPLAALTVSITFAICIYGGAKAGDSRRDGNAAFATLYAGLSVLAGLVALGVCVLGVAIIIAA
jgi:hypothetical protein